LSHYLQTRLSADKSGAPQVVNLLGPKFAVAELQTFCESVSSFLESSTGRAALAEGERITAHLDAASRSIGLEGDELALNFRERLKSFAEDFHFRWQTLQDRRIEAREADKDNVASALGSEQQRLLGQYLVEALSRAAVIPTYSFPVHSCRLEITQQRGGFANRSGGAHDSALQLTRSATMAISEYAPGAEVVAGRRIWVSAGIVRYPKDFMPEQWARTCPTCQHVDIQRFRDAFDERCCQCGNNSFPFSCGPFPFIEPKAFMTAYTDRKGRDPSSSRLRQRSAEEARLVTQVPAESYEDTDFEGVKTFYAPAKPTGGDTRPAGQLFLLNKGPFGAGYLRCSKCEYSEPAPAAARLGKSHRAIHNNPRTGDRCPIESIAYPVGLGHIFGTDVRTISFSAPIPLSPDRDPEAASLHRIRFLRTRWMVYHPTRDFGRMPHWWG